MLICLFCQRVEFKFEGLILDVNAQSRNSKLVVGCCHCVLNDYPASLGVTLF